MLCAPTSSHDLDDGPARQRAEDAQYYREVLHKLIALGSDLAAAVVRQATAEPGPTMIEDAAGQRASQRAPCPDPSIAFDRIARAVRRTIALARKLSEPDRAPPRGKQVAQTAQQGAQESPQHARQRHLAARKRIIGAVEDTIRRHAEGADAEALYADLYERLDDPDLDADIEQLLLADVIAALCRDLGLAGLPDSHPWKPRTPAGAQASAPEAGSPPTLRGTGPPPAPA